MTRRTAAASANVIALAAHRPDDITSLAEEFDHELEAAGRTAKTRRNYRDAVNLLATFLRDTGRPTVASAITRRDIEDFFIDLRGRPGRISEGMTRATIDNRDRSLRPFLNFLAREGIIDCSPMADLRRPEPDDSIRAPIPDDDLRRLLRATAGQDFEDRRDAALIAFFADTGARLGEVASMRLSDLDLARKEARVTGKTGPRLVAFGSQTRRDIERYLRERARHPQADSRYTWIGQRGRLLESGIGQIIKRRARKAGVRVHPHLFRHTWATRFLLGDDEVPPGHETDLMRAGGWKGLDMVARYTRAAGAERAREAVRRRSLVDRLRR